MHCKFPIVWLFLIFYYWWCCNEQLCTKSLFLLFKLFPYDNTQEWDSDQRQERFLDLSMYCHIAFPMGLTDFNITCHVSSSFCSICEFPRYNIPYCSNGHAVDCSPGRCIRVWDHSLLSFADSGCSFVFADPVPRNMTLDPLCASLAEHMQTPEADTVQKA